MAGQKGTRRVKVARTDDVAPGSEARYVIITGLSGAGKSLAVQSLEDLGYFCVDNLPPTLIPKFAELCAQSGGAVRRIALVVDIRGGQFFDRTSEALEMLDEIGLPYRILFLEATDEVLVRRFKETRRRHPLAPHGRVLEGIAAERRRLEEIRGRAHVIIDTSKLAPQKLKDEVIRAFGQDDGLDRLIISVISFGFKYGLPLDADLVFDVRFLPNPQYVPSLRRLSGLDPAVVEYVMKWPLTNRLLRRLRSLLDFLVPQYVNEGKSQLVVAVGCTGGRHRSVTVAEHLAESLGQHGQPVITEHRDVNREEANELPGGDKHGS